MVSSPVLTDACSTYRLSGSSLTLQIPPESKRPPPLFPKHPASACPHRLSPLPTYLAPSVPPPSSLADVPPPPLTSGYPLDFDTRRSQPTPPLLQVNRHSTREYTHRILPHLRADFSV